MSRTRFQSESTRYSCLNVKELLARSRREIWRWSDCNWTRTQNHLVLKQTLNHLTKLTKWLSCVLSTYLYGAFSLYVLVMSHTRFQSESTLYSCLNVKNVESSCSHFTFRFRACFEQGVPWHSGNYRVWIHSENAYVTWQEHTVKMHRTDKYSEHSSIIWSV